MLRMSRRLMLGGAATTHARRRRAGLHAGDAKIVIRHVRVYSFRSLSVTEQAENFRVNAIKVENRFVSNKEPRPDHHYNKAEQFHCHSVDSAGGLSAERWR